MTDLVIQIFTKDGIREQCAALYHHINDHFDGEALTIEVKKFKKKRTVDQNALMHMWFREIAVYLERHDYQVPIDSMDQGKGFRAINAEDVKFMLKHKFLGTETVSVGKIVYENQLKQTSALSKGEMMDFLDKIYDWAGDRSIPLTNPSDSEYMKLKQSQFQ